MKHQALCYCAAMLTMLAATEVMAGGLFIPLHGVATSGRAGAAVVSTRDPNAIAYNPALIALTEGHQLLVDLTWGMLQLEFQRAPQENRQGQITVFEPVHNLAPGVVIPQLLFTTDFGTDTLGLGVGIFPPNAAPVRFPTQGPQRYAIIDMANTIAFTTELAFAWRPHPRIAIGAGIQNVTFVFRGAGIASTYLGVFGEAEDPEVDSVISVHAVDAFTPSANFGIWAEPVDRFEIGAAFQLFSDHKSRGGKFKVALPDHYAYEITQVNHDKMDISFSLPWSLRIGMRYKHDNLFDIELNAWIERWSRHKSINLHPRNVYLINNALVDDVRIDNFSLPRNMKDTYGIAIGSDWNILPDRLTLRMGFLYESGAAGDQNYSVFLYDNHKFAPTIGASVYLDFVRLDFSFAHVHQLSKTVTNGNHKQYNLVWPEGAVVTNNGTYKSFYDFIGIGANFTF